MPLAEAAIAGAVELTKVLVVAYFTAARMANLTPEQLDKMYEEEKAKFLANDPNKIPD